jgi:hypothetical protein
MDFWLKNAKTKKEAIGLMNISKKTFYKYYKILQEKKLLVNLIKLLVCLRKGNSFSGTKKFSVIVENFFPFFDVFFNFSELAVFVQKEKVMVAQKEKVMESG